jgi:hypothetical protein
VSADPSLVKKLSGWTLLQVLKIFSNVIVDPPDTVVGYKNRPDLQSF